MRISEEIIMKTVLYADDNDEIIEIVKLVLDGKDYNLITVSNGEEAVKVCVEQQPALVLMDINMPGLNGFDATKKLREGGFSNPIIILTGSEAQEDRQQAEAVGCTDYILKTVDMNNVGTVIDHHLGEIGKLIE